MQDVVHRDSITERHRRLVPHLRLTPEQRRHLTALRAAYLVRSALLQRQREEAAKLLATLLPLADFMSQVLVTEAFRHRSGFGCGVVEVRVLGLGFDSGYERISNFRTCRLGVPPADFR